MKENRLRISMGALTVLRHIAQTEIYRRIYEVLESLDADAETFCKSYSKLCSYILEHKTAGQLLYEGMLYDDNVFARSCGGLFSDLPEKLVQAADFDLQVINSICALTAKEVIAEAASNFPSEAAFINLLPLFPDSGNFSVKSAKMLYEVYHNNGYGYFAQGTAYFVENGQAVYIEKPDSIRLSDLKGYKRQKKEILANTLSFLEGKEANNILMYGDKGTGKSSTVKAVVNYLAHRGLKIIELKISQIREFPAICKEVAKSPFHFILFLDDLCFNVEDENFTELKAFIEGGISGKPDNILIYATSNRRHMVREGMSERALADDVHLRDTLETITSLYDRFGLEITFSVPDKDEYLDIVDKLAIEYGIEMEEETLHLLAERFALRRSGRSPRTARQFINHQISLLSEEQAYI